jgi:hypothetical protein
VAVLKLRMVRVLLKQNYPSDNGSARFLRKYGHGPPEPMMSTANTPFI